MLRGPFCLIWGACLATVLTLSAGAADQPNSGTENHYRAKQILGATVSIQDSSSVGTVDDIVLDDNGNVDYVILKRSDDKLVTVPWDAIRFSIEKRSAVIHIPVEMFNQVPIYTIEHYPVFSAPTYRSEIYRYYGLTPGRERRLIRRGAIPR
jgi:hypothetical protein